MNLSFTINASWANHEIWRDNTTGFNFAPLVTLEPGVSSYSDATGSVANTYKVRAIGAGDPSDFATYGILFIQDGALLLRSDDGNWYFVRLTTIDGETSIQIDQTPTAAPPYGAEYVVFTPDQNYDFRLKTENGAVVWDVNQTPDPASVVVGSLTLQSDDGNFYVLSLAIDDVTGEVRPEVNQTPA